MAQPKPFKIQLVGEMRILCGERLQALPPSRKTRGLLAYLALEEGVHRREDLCQLLWEDPNDPRAALRWSLSKLRPLLRLGDETALRADRNTVSLDRNHVAVDALEIRTVAAEDLAGFSNEDLIRLERSAAGPYLSGMDDLGSVHFQLWLGSERNTLSVLQRRVLDELVSRESMAESMRLQFAGKRVALDPLNDDSNVEYLRLTKKFEGLSAARVAFDRMREHYEFERRPTDALTSAWLRLTDDDSGERHRSQAPIPSGEHEAAVVSEELPDRPSLAVLDFTDLGSDTEGAVLAKGLVVDINSRLAQLPNLFVIARASSARIGALQLSPREISRRLGVRYLIGGSTQHHGNRVRVTVSLLDALEENEVWSEHFDRPLDDLFEIQDDITHALVATIEPAIERAEMQRALLKPPDSLTAWERFHRGLWHAFRFTARDNEIAHRFFREALSLDPRFSRAHAGMSFTHYSRAFLNSVANTETEIHESLEAAQKSVALDSRDAMGHWSHGRALFLSRQHDAAIHAIDQALAVKPSYAQGHYARGFIGIHSDIDAIALGSLDTAQRLSPFDPLVFAMNSSRGVSFANQGRFEEAASWAIRATHEPNAHFHIFAIAAGCLELAGRSADARNNARWVLDRHPGYSVDVYRRSFPHKDESRREALLAAMVRSGIPR